MARKNIYEILEAHSFDTQEEFMHLRYVFDHEICFCYNDYSYFGAQQNYTFYEFAKEFIFKLLPIRGTYIDFDELMKSGLGIRLSGQLHDLDDLLCLIEFICCIEDTAIQSFMLWSCHEAFRHMDDIINQILDKAAHKLIETPKGRIAVPRSIATEQAAQLLVNEDEKISLSLLQYNHRSNAGNLNAKKKLSL